MAPVVRTELLPTWIFPSSPVLSILLATFTVLPQMSYWGFLAPMTPAITGPWLIPARREAAAAPDFSCYINCIPGKTGSKYSFITLCLSRMLSDKNVKIIHKKQ